MLLGTHDGPCSCHNTCSLQKRSLSTEQMQVSDADPVVQTSARLGSDLQPHCTPAHTPKVTVPEKPAANLGFISSRQAQLSLPMC